jgi:hypothetical protein
MIKKEKTQIAVAAMAAVVFVGIVAAATAPDKPTDRLFEQSVEEQKLEANDLQRALSYARSQLDGGDTAQFRSLHILILSDGTPADDSPYLCGEVQAGGRLWRGFIAYYTAAVDTPPILHLVNPHFPAGPPLHNQIDDKTYRSFCRL